MSNIEQQQLKKYVQWVLAVALAMSFLVSPVQAYSYTINENKEISWNKFYINVTTDYPLSTLKSVINSSKASNIVIDSWGKNGSDFWAYGHLKNYSIRKNKLFNPWWNVSKNYAAHSTVTNPNTTVIYLNLNNASGTSNTTTIFGNGTFLSNFHSINVTVNNVTEIPYRINNISGGVANISVNVSTVTAGQYVDVYWTNLTDDGTASNFNDTFMGGGDYKGTVIDTTRWIEVDPATYITQNERLFIQGTGAWGDMGISSLQNFTRPFVYKTYFTVNSVSSNSAIGIKDITTGISYVDFVYGVLFINGDILFYEDGNYVGIGGTYTANTDYWFMIEVLNTGAKYYNSTNNGTTWNLMYSSVYSTENPLKIGASQYYPTPLTQLDDTIVYNTTSPMPTWTGWGATQTYQTINISSWSNNYTNNQSLTFTIYKNSSQVVNFNVSANITSDIFSWFVNGSNQSHNFNNFSYNFSTDATVFINVTVWNSSYNNYDNKNWTVTYIYTPYLYSVSGYVNNTLGADVIGALVSINGSSDLTDLGGYYSISNISNGTYSILTRGIGYRNKTSTITISSNTINNITLSERMQSAIPVSPGFEGIILVFIISILIISKRKVQHE